MFAEAARLQSRGLEQFLASQEKADLHIREIVGLDLKALAREKQAELGEEEMERTEPMLRNYVHALADFVEAVVERETQSQNDNKQIPRAPNSPSEVSDRAAPSVQAPASGGILLPPPRVTDAAAAAVPLEALVSPDEGGPSAPRTDGGKKRNFLKNDVGSRDQVARAGGREDGKENSGGGGGGCGTYEESNTPQNLSGSGRRVSGVLRDTRRSPPSRSGRGRGRVADGPSSQERLRRGAGATS
uniref:Uncharacterized protein n=1 Tax=Chromera velia CCMP2878 TaxID=1169474 RepID=A0A0G4HAF6_9ALVE|eukprot:Cvel_25673.t1-p1 / transcript=Cvel_25673.t1 / gene=Cvel_25673 / organism=Chromera_velia_CCMP2878 / gene_product=hypothetical protein / transcript_product=hypothetical protein / location=Cvel_scaffold2942:1208-3611(+) / protein_length=243 / sequence_SO=supercontig / SO=protein_coding / is_pseudo=false